MMLSVFYLFSLRDFRVGMVISEWVLSFSNQYGCFRVGMSVSKSTCSFPNRYGRVWSVLSLHVVGYIGSTKQTPTW